MSRPDILPKILVALPRTLVDRLAPGALAEANRLAAGLEDPDERQAWAACHVGRRVAHEIEDLEADALYASRRPLRKPTAMIHDDCPGRKVGDDTRPHTSAVAVGDRYTYTPPSGHVAHYRVATINDHVCLQADEPDWGDVIIRPDGLATSHGWARA
jgi:hypothetical protein